jgi:hypothetical protein
MSAEQHSRLPTAEAAALSWLVHKAFSDLFGGAIIGDKLVEIDLNEIIRQTVGHVEVYNYDLKPEILGELGNIGKPRRLLLEGTEYRWIFCSGEHEGHLPPNRKWSPYIEHFTVPTRTQPHQG